MFSVFGINSEIGVAGRWLNVLNNAAAKSAIIVASLSYCYSPMATTSGIYLDGRWSL
jgi:hypothetical protein